MGFLRCVAVACGFRLSSLSVTICLCRVLTQPFASLWFLCRVLFVLCVFLCYVVHQARDAKLAAYEDMIKDQLTVIESQQSVINALTKSHTISARGAL